MVYFPFNKNFDLEPQCVDEFSFKVNLPFTKKKLKNSLYSPKSAEYFRGFWLKRVPLLTRTIVSTIEKANGMKLPANNQQQEGMNKNEKVVEGDLRAKTAEPGAWFWYRYLALCNGSKYMVSELERLEGYTERRREWTQRKEQERTERLAFILAYEDEEKTDDARALEKESNTNMEFERKGKQGWMDDEEDLRKVLLNAFATIGINSKNKQQDELTKHGKKRMNPKLKFMSKPTYNGWIAKDPKIRKLLSDQLEIMDSFIRWCDEREEM